MSVGRASILDDRSIQRGQYMVVALAMAVLILDGIDIQLLSFVAPVVLREWGVAKSALGPALAASFAGMTIGSLGGLLGDRWGRKRVLLTVMSVGRASILDDRSIQRGQYMVVALAMAVLILDGIDIQLLSFVAPVVLREWGVAKSALGPALAASFAGMTIGSLGGLLGDRWGRKRVLLASMVLFGGSTIAIAWSRNIGDLTVLRFISGIGFGAAYPNAFVLATEWLPTRARGRAVAVLTSSVPIGGMIGSVAAIALIPMLGWRGCFIACGVTVLTIGVIALRYMPESIAFLIARGRLDAARAALVRVIGTSDVVLPRTDATSTAEVPVPAEEAETLFSRSLMRTNIGGVLAYAAIAFVSYALVGWIPTILSGAGLPLARALQGSMAFNTLSLIATFGCPFLLQRFGSRFLLLAATCVAMALLIGTGVLIDRGGGQDGWWPILLLACCGFLGIATGLLITTSFTLANTAYTARARAGGMGLVMFGGRVGGIASLSSSGLLLEAGGGRTIVMFGLFAAILLIVIAATAILDRHIPAQRER